MACSGQAATSPPDGAHFLYVGSADVQWDAAYGLNLLYMHARHYSPTLGRFLQPDPSRLESQLFPYAGNAPVTNVDPSGHGFFIPILIIVGRAMVMGLPRIAQLAKS